MNSRLAFERDASCISLYHRAVLNSIPCGKHGTFAPSHFNRHAVLFAFDAGMIIEEKIVYLDHVGYPDLRSACYQQSNVCIVSPLSIS